MAKKGSLKSSLLLLLCSLIWGASFIGQKLGMNSIGPFFFVAWRMLLGGVALFPVYLVSERSADKAAARGGSPRTAEEKSRLRRTGLLGGLCCGVLIYLASVMQQFGLQTASAGKTAFITALYVILVPLAGILFGNRTTLNVWLGAVLAVVGLYLLCMTKDDFSLAFGDLIVLIGAFFWASHVLATDHFAPRANVTLIVCVQSLSAGVIGFAVAFIKEDFSWSGLLGALPAILFVAVLSTAFAFSLQAYAQKDSDPTVTAIIVSLESVFAAISGFLFLEESLSAREVLGCVIMFAAIILAQLPGPKAKSRPAA